MMENLHDTLRRLLRLQMTAVNQQFVHMVALRNWGETEFADRIGQVDDADFPVCMKLMDFFVAENVPMALPFGAFDPGNTVESIVAAELRIEREMQECLSIEVAAPHPAAAWMADALRPRKAYAEWLVAQKFPLIGGPEPTNVTDTPVNKMFAELIALIEQAMAHAFVHWHHGDRRDADIAWATSGVAMVRARLLTLALSDLGETPKAPATAQLVICTDPASAIRCDRDLARVCADRASVAARATSGKTMRVCRQIEDFAGQVAEHRTGEHPSARMASPAFGGFLGTLEKYVKQPAPT